MDNGFRDTHTTCTRRILIASAGLLLPLVLSLAGQTAAAPLSHTPARTAHLQQRLTHCANRRRPPQHTACKASVRRREHRVGERRVSPAHHAGAPATPAKTGATRVASAPAAVASTAPCANVDLTPTSNNLAAVQSATLCLVNQVRGEHGLPALSENSDLQQAALGHNNDMVARDYFEHTDPSGGTPLSRIEATGYIANNNISYLVGENIAWGTLSLSTPAAIVNAWVNSPDHLANILDATYTDTGLAVNPQAPASLAQGQQGAIYTEDFGGIDSGA